MEKIVHKVAKEEEKPNGTPNLRHRGWGLIVSNFLELIDFG